jgi:hypothetical protein
MFSRYGDGACLLPWVHTQVLAIHIQWPFNVASTWYLLSMLQAAPSLQQWACSLTLLLLWSMRAEPGRTAVAC